MPLSIIIIFGFFLNACRFNLEIFGLIDVKKKKRFEHI